MKLKKKALLYDIANLAYVIADTGDCRDHGLHRVKDVCQAGNIDRVSRILGLAYSRILHVLSPILEVTSIDISRDYSSMPHDYPINFREEATDGYRITPELKLKIKETAHEYMVAMVLADWLGITLPPAADVWKDRSESAFNTLARITAGLTASSLSFFHRKTNPF